MPQISPMNWIMISSFQITNMIIMLTMKMKFFKKSSYMYKMNMNKFMIWN